MLKARILVPSSCFLLSVDKNLNAMVPTLTVGRQTYTNTGYYKLISGPKRKDQSQGRVLLVCQDP